MLKFVYGLFKKNSSKKIFIFTLIPKSFAGESGYYAPGELALRNKKLEISGVLELTEFDKVTKPKFKKIYGDGHSHIVSLSPKAWEVYEKNQQLIIRTDLDGQNRDHSHWIRVL